MTNTRYSKGAIAFHWAIALLVIVNLVIGLFHESLFNPAQVMPLHKSLGILILVLTIGRIAWRLGHRPPPLPVAMSGFERMVMKGTHLLFYILLIAVPMSGWVMSSNPARPRPVDFFGLGELPLLPVSGSMAGAAHEGHEIMGLFMAALVVLHVAAALRHHFLLRDGLLRRMMP